MSSFFTPRSWDPQSVHAQQKAFVEGIMRDNNQHRLAQEARPARRRWYSRRVDWLLCELDFQRITLAERLERHSVAQTILRGKENALFSAGRCA